MSIEDQPPPIPNESTPVWEYQEALDLVVYLRQAIEERSAQSVDSAP